jgi:uncharacterized coiled-coil DUF342 family protein
MIIVYITLVAIIFALAKKLLIYQDTYNKLLAKSKDYLSLSKRCNNTSKEINQQNKDLLDKLNKYFERIRELTKVAEQLHQDNFELRKEIREVKEMNKKLEKSIRAGKKNDEKD